MGRRDYCQNMHFGDERPRVMRPEGKMTVATTDGKVGGETSCPCPSFQTNDCPALYASKGSRHRKAFLRTLARRNSPQNCLLDQTEEPKDGYPHCAYSSRDPELGSKQKAVRPARFSSRVLVLWTLVLWRSVFEGKGVGASGEWGIGVDVCIQVLLVGRCMGVGREKES